MGSQEYAIFILKQGAWSQVGPRLSSVANAATWVNIYRTFYPDDFFTIGEPVL